MNTQPPSYTLDELWKLWNQWEEEAVQSTTNFVFPSAVEFLRWLKVKQEENE